MKKVFGWVFLSFFLFIHFSCNSSSNQSIGKLNNNSTELSANKADNNQIENTNSADLSGKFAERYRNNPQMYSSMVYGIVFTSIAYGNEFDSLTPAYMLGFKRETIMPVNVEKLKTFDYLNLLTIESFIERNQTKEKLEDDYDVKYALKVIDEKKSDEKLLFAANKKNNRIKSIVGLSRIGFSTDYTQSLTYVEYYGLNKTLQRKYLLITWDIFEAGSRVKNTKWFSAQ